MSSEVIFKNKNLIYQRANLDINTSRIFDKILYKLQKKILTEMKDRDIAVSEAEILDDLIKNEKQIPNDIFQSLSVDLTKEEYFEVFKKTETTTPKGMEANLKKIMSTIIRFPSPSNPNHIILVNLITKVVMDLDTLSFKLCIDKDLFRYLIKYEERGGYAQICNKSKGDFKSYYSRTFYDIFRKATNENKKELTLDVSEIRDIFMLNDSYDRYTDLFKNVIKSSIDEINASNLMEIEVKGGKTGNRVGRKVVSVTFLLKDKKPSSLVFDNKSNKKVDKNNSETYVAEADKCKENSYKKNNSYNNKRKPLKFNNFEAREYDYEALEMKLLGWDEDDKEGDA